MDNSIIRNKPSSPTPIIQYRYSPSGQIVKNYISYGAPPVTPMKYRDLSSKPSEIRKKSIKSPATLLNSDQSLSLKSKLTLSINQREIYIMQNGSSVFPGQKLSGFHYNLNLSQKFDRFSHSEEMKFFFKECSKNFHSTKSEFKFAFSIKGKVLHCLHELKSEEKIVLVGKNSVFLGIHQIETPDTLKSYKRSPLYKSLHDDSEISLVENLNSHFKISYRKSRGSSDQGDCYKSPKPAKFKPGKLKLNDLKLKLGVDSYNIDRSFPTLYSQGLQKLKERFNFTEQELHNLYGKFKLLVLLSCGINSNHDISKGIARETFVDYYSKSAEISRILGKIFDKFDLDSGGTVSWDEYLQAMDIIWHGTTEIQLDFFFSVYDTDGNGLLSFKEIQELCRLQLQMEKADQLIEELSFSFASLIFDLTETKYDEEVPAYKIKEIIKKQQDKSLMEMFCSFSCLK